MYAMIMKMTRKFPLLLINTDQSNLVQFFWLVTVYLPQEARDFSNSHKKATSQLRTAWTFSFCFYHILIWMGTNFNIDSLIKGNVNSLLKWTSIDMLSNSAVLVSCCWIIYISQWNINAECHGCRRESKLRTEIESDGNQSLVFKIC